jgi:hypothetical protein
MHLCVKCQYSQLNTIIFRNNWWAAQYQLASDAWIKAVSKDGGKCRLTVERKENYVAVHAETKSVIGG